MVPHWSLEKGKVLKPHIWKAQYRSAMLSGLKRKNLFEDAISIKAAMGGWLTGWALERSTNTRVSFNTDENYIQFAMSIAGAFGYDEQSRFHLPGIGKSDAGKLLIDNGVSNVVVGGIGDASILSGSSTIQIPMCDWNVDGSIPPRVGAARAGRSALWHELADRSLFPS